jgi:probable rRNA maturation factor
MIEINNVSGSSSLEKRIFSTVAKKVLSGENRKTETVSLAFVGKEEMKNLNKKFRGKDKATDVLSFDLKNTSIRTENKYLGEIIICPEVVEENSEKYGFPAKKEMLKVFIHGILHLCGYDHEKSTKDAEKMEKKEKFYLSKI